MGMRRAGRPELEHRQVRTEFEHQRCELRSSAGAEREHRRNDVPWECDGPEGRSLSTVRCERSSSTRGASCDLRWVQPMPSGTPPVRPTTRSSSATTAGRTQRPTPSSAVRPTTRSSSATTRRVCRSPSAFSCSCRTLCSRQSRLLRHLHPKDRPDLVLPGRCHPRRGRDLGRRRARTGVRGEIPPSRSTPARLLVIYYLFSSLSYDALASPPQRPDFFQRS